MNDEKLRLKCLKMAGSVGLAQDYYDFVKNIDKPDELERIDYSYLNYNTGSGYYSERAPISRSTSNNTK